MKKKYFTKLRCAAFICLSFLVGQAQAQTIHIAPGTVLTNNGATITVANSNIQNEGQLVSVGGVFVFSGNNTNMVTGTGTTAFHSVHINKINGGKLVLQKDVSASGAVVFNSGLLDIGNNFLELKYSGGSLQNENESNRVVSTGTGEVYIIQNLTAPSLVNPGNLGMTISSGQNPGLTTIYRGNKAQVAASGDQSINRYYRIEATNNANLNATLRVQYFDVELNNNSESALNFWQYNGQWQSIGATTRNANQNYVELAGINELTQFTLGKMLSGGEFQLTSFTGNCKGPNARFQWKTLNEQQISQYILEKSTDGANWQVAATVAVNPANQNTYAVQVAPAGAIYYRLKIAWLNGQFTYSDPIQMDCNKVKGNNGGPQNITKPGGIMAEDDDKKTDDGISLHAGPNPTRGMLAVTIKLFQPGPVIFELRDLNGRIMLRKQMSMLKGIGSSTLDLSPLPAGTYLLSVSGSDFRKSQMIIKQ